jgi:CBS domain-containing protein
MPHDAGVPWSADRKRFLIEVNDPLPLQRYCFYQTPEALMRKLSDIVFNQHPLTMRPTACVKDACEGMRESRAGSVLVIDDQGRLVGIFTGRDAVCRVVAAGKTAETTVLADVMTPEPTTMPPDTTAIEALRLMWDGGFRHIPIVDRGKLLGVVSRGDFKGSERDRLEEERELWEHLR